MNTTDAIALVAMVVGLGSLLVSIWSYQAGNRAVEQAEVTAYLRKIWIDSVQADYDSQVIGGAVSDDREKALARRRAMIDTADLDKLREVFKPDLKV